MAGRHVAGDRHIRIQRGGEIGKGSTRLCFKGGPAKRGIATITLVSLILAACGGGTTTVDESAVVADPTATAAAEPTAQPEPTATEQPVEPTATAEPESPSWADDLAIGSCFDDVGTPEAPSPGSPIDCDDPHHAEVYLIAQAEFGADEPYPDATTLANDVRSDTCIPGVDDFGGDSWERVPFDVMAWVPDQADWETGDRTVVCTVRATLLDTNPYLIGTARGGSLDSSEGVVGLATVGGQRDFYFSFEASGIYPLTSGRFEIPPRSPKTDTSGFMFASPLQDAEEPGVLGYQYEYATGEIRPLALGVPETWEVASPLFVTGAEPSFVFAARETDADDWDLYRSTTAAGPVKLTDNDTDDSWPTLTPDNEQIVYSASGDIWIMNVDGTDPTQLTTDPAGDYESAVSPDGTKIAFASDRSGNDDVWLMNVDGSEQTNLTVHPANEAWPFWSADGSIVYYQTDRLGVKSHLMMMEADGSNHSWYSVEITSHAALLPDAVTERFKAELTPLSDSGSAYSIVAGDAGDVAEVVHSSQRLAIEFPAGWEYTEVEPGEGVIAALLGGESVDAFYETWAVDAALITLIEEPVISAWGERLDAVAAATDCDFVDESIDVNGARLTETRRYTCGEVFAVVIGIYESEADLGVIFEGQYDGLPDVAADEALMTAIGRSLRFG